MRLAVAATPALAIPTLERLSSSSHELAFIVSRPDRPSGRGREIKESAVAQWARSNELLVYKPEDISEISEPLKQVDLLLTIAFGKILPLNILSATRHGSINMHFSLLPRWRGAAPVQRAIEAGDELSGITIFALDQGMDTGPIYLKKSYPIPTNDSSGEVLETLSQLGPDLIFETIDLISSGVEPTPQEEVGVSYAAKVTKDEAQIQWEESAEIVCRKIRAFTPEPGSWTRWRGEPLRISQSEIADRGYGLKPGEISIVEGQVLVGCGLDSSIRLNGVRPAGKKSMSADAWSNGARIVAGDFFDQK